MTPAKIRDTISDATTLLGRIADLASYVGPGRAQDQHRRAAELSLDVEREHRRFGRSFTHGQASYRVSAGMCADMFVVQLTGRALSERGKPASWTDVASVRPDVIQCYALAESIRAALRAKPSDELARGRLLELRRWVKRFRSHPVHSIDYAGDIAS